MAMSVVYTTVNGQILSESRGGTVSHFVPDPLGSVVMVRDTSGNTVYEAEYDPYGNVQSETGTNPSSLGYVGTLGYIKDSASSMYVRARYLLSNLGRWLTKDPLWPSEPGYIYAGADPISMVDRDGLQPGGFWPDWRGRLCRASCAAAAAIACAAAFLSCTVGTFVTIGGLGIPCVFFIIMICALSAFLAALCTDSCTDKYPPPSACFRPFEIEPPQIAHLQFSRSV
jgi:RHS repeat-associated protein